MDPLSQMASINQSFVFADDYQPRVFKAWENVLTAYTHAMLKSTVLEGVTVPDMHRLFITKINYFSARDSFITKTLSFARAITNIIDKALKGLVLTFAALAIINIAGLPFTFPKVILLSAISLNLALFSSVFKLATVALDKGKEKWMDSYLSPKDKSEIANLKKWQKISNLDEIANSLKAVNTAYKAARTLEAYQISRPEWNTATIAKKEEFQRKIDLYKAQVNVPYFQDFLAKI